MTEQLDLFSEEPEPKAHARRGDPATSHEAAASITSDQMRASQRAVLAMFRVHGPMHDPVLEQWYQAHLDRGDNIPPQTPQGIRSRRSELVKAGLLEDSGERTRTKSGRNATVWRVRPSPSM